MEKYREKICYNCGGKILPYRNIFMFQDNEFCTQECRYEIMKNCNNIK